jgi:hypothetical protein
MKSWLSKIRRSFAVVELLTSLLVLEVYSSSDFEVLQSGQYKIEKGFNMKRWDWI